MASDARVEHMVITIEEAAIDAQGRLCVSGWAAGEAMVTSVEIVAAGVKWGDAEHGLARPDIAAEFPDLVDVERSGFTFVGALDERARAAEQVVVIVRAEGQPVQAAARGLTRPPEQAPDDRLRLNCENVALYDDGLVEISGWAVHPDEVEAIEVRIDDEPIGAATFGAERGDVAHSHPDIASAARSGFDFRTVRAPFAIGEHELALVARTRAGGRFERTLAVAVQIARRPIRATDSLDIRLSIDSPSIVDDAVAQPVRRLLTIEGWAIARHGVAAVELFLDGAPVGVASRGTRRLDIAAAYPDWPDALMSGFTALLPRKVFSKETQALRIVARDKRGQVQELDLLIKVAPAELEDESAPLRAFVSQAEIDMKMRLIAAAGPLPAFAVLIAPGAEDGWARTLESLEAQVYRGFRVGALAPGAELPVFEGELAAAVETLLDGETGYFLCLRAGDRLGVDALLEFALDIVTRPEEDFRYADDRRLELGRGRVAAFLKPEWSPDLLLSTNYIGRAWCASRELLGRVRLTVADVVEAGDYDLTLRLTEAAREIGRAPLVLAETAPASDGAAREIAALRAAMRRRKIEGGVRATAAPGVYRLRRRVATRGLVSIVIPTIASGGLIERCVASLRRLTHYRRFEIVCVDNIADRSSPWTDWLKRNADCVVEYPAPFNWSKLNNLGAEAALGEYLLFLNDDVEAIEPRWLHALMEHAQRREVGVVGPRLLYPDGRIQHAGLFLHDSDGRHAFRFAEREDVGRFGLAAAQRNVAGLTGACLLMRRAAFDEVGGFDERHSVVNNDLDLCLRMWRAGLRVVYTPHATLIHHEMASRAEVADTFDESGFKSAWRSTFALGDPFFHPRLSRDAADYAPDAEPTRVIVAGAPLIARESVRRILVQKLDHVGDFVTALPAVRRLKQRFPQAEITVLAPAPSVALARLEPAISHAIEFNFFHFISQQGRREIDEAEWAALEARLKPHRFDIAIDLRKHPESREALKRSGARLTAGFDSRHAFPWLDVALEWDGDERYLAKRAHVGDDCSALVEAVSLACENERGGLAAPPSGEALAQWGGLFERPVVGVHPAAGSVLRQWPPEHFAELIDLLTETYAVNVALFGTAAEAPIAEATHAATRGRERVWSLVGRTRVDELPSLLRGLVLFVGNNSGPHHLAAALGTPTIGVHSGVVSAREWGPVGPMAAAVQREMSCGPCYLAKASDCPRGLACLHGLRPAEVFRVCEQMLGAKLRHGVA